MSLGQPYPEFWTLTLREVVLVCDAIRERKRDEIGRARVLNQELAHLVAYAYHNPKEMPDLTKDRQDAPTDDETGANALRAGLLGWGMLLDRQGQTLCQQ